VIIQKTEESNGLNLILEDIGTAINYSICHFNLFIFFSLYIFVPAYLACFICTAVSLCNSLCNYLKLFDNGPGGAEICSGPYIKANLNSCRNQHMHTRKDVQYFYNRVFTDMSL
jgi:hypothetical protein